MGFSGGFGMSKFFRVLSTLALAYFCSTAQEAKAATFSLLELGTLGGTTSVAVDLNNNGQVVGWSYLSGGPESAASPHPTVWQAGVAPIDLSSSGQPTGNGITINALGQVGGLSFGNTPHATVWTGTAAVNLGTFGGRFSSANGINNQGQVVGVSQNASGVNRAFSWSNGSLMELSSLPGTNSSQAFGINSQGQIVGRNDLSSGAVQATICTEAAPALSRISL